MKLGEVPLTNTSKTGSINKGGNAFFFFRDLGDGDAFLAATNLLRRDLKLRGCIGDHNANQNDQLSFVSVKHQIYEAQREGYIEHEIVSSVIRSMHSGLRLKSILKMKSNLTLATLKGYLQHRY